MSYENYTVEIHANLERSEQAIEAAGKLLHEGYYDFAASRAYYAAFYAAMALLLKEGMEFSKHSGVISAIHRRFIKTGKLEERFGKDLNWLFELRSVGDYGVTVHVPQQEAEHAIEAARNFVQAAQSVKKPKKNQCCPNQTLNLIPKVCSPRSIKERTLVPEPYIMLCTGG